MLKQKLLEYKNGDAAVIAEMDAKYGARTLKDLIMQDNDLNNYTDLPYYPRGLGERHLSYC